MFIYERDGKLNIMIEGGKPADIGETADIVIEAVSGEAKVLVNGKEVEVALDKINIAVNKNQIPNDTLPPMKSSGIRIGVPAMTTKGWKENDFEQLAGIINGFLINLKNNLVDDDLIDLFKKQVKHLKDKVNERNNKNG